jgi:hypothetical protein
MPSLMMVIAPKHVGAVLMSILMYILKLFLRQFTCASVGGKNFDPLASFIVYLSQYTLLRIECCG